MHENVYSCVCAHVYVHVHICVCANVPRPELEVCVRAIMCVYTYILISRNEYTHAYARVYNQNPRSALSLASLREIAFPPGLSAAMSE